MNKSHATILIVLALVLGLLVGYQWGHAQAENAQVTLNENTGDNNNDNDEENETPAPTTPTPQTTTFTQTTEDGYYGTLTLNGYIEVLQRENVKYAYFVFDKVNNTALDAFMDMNDGNSFAGANKIGIGCHQEPQKRIFYQNFSDKGNIEGTIVGADYDKLMASTSTKKVQLKMYRDIYTSGQGAPECYSHFRGFDVL
jgi:hypothetical protein